MATLSVGLRSGPPLRPEGRRVPVVDRGPIGVTSGPRRRAGPASSGNRRSAPERERAHSDGDGLRRRDLPLDRGAPLAAPAAVSSPPRRRPIDTHVSQEMPSAGRATPRRRGARFSPQLTAPGLRPPTRQGACATPRAGSTAAMISSGRARRPARRASPGTGTRTFPPMRTPPRRSLLLLVRRVPVLPRGFGRAQRKAAASALWTACGLPHRLGIMPALLPRRRHARAVRLPPLRAHARPSGPRLPIVRGARGLALRTQRGGGTRPAPAPGRPTDRGPLPTATT